MGVNYYPFGWSMPGRKYQEGDYRFGFNGQEQDTEWRGGQAVNFKYRVHDPRIAKFLSVDPLAPDYTWNSPYAFAENRVIDGIDLEGLEWKGVTDKGEYTEGPYNPKVAEENGWIETNLPNTTVSPAPINETEPSSLATNRINNVEVDLWAIQGSIGGDLYGYTGKSIMELSVGSVAKWGSWEGKNVYHVHSTQVFEGGSSTPNVGISILPAGPLTLKGVDGTILNTLQSLKNDETFTTRVNTGPLSIIFKEVKSEGYPNIRGSINGISVGSGAFPIDFSWGKFSGDTIIETYSLKTFEDSAKYSLDNLNVDTTGTFANWRAQNWDRLYGNDD